MTSSTTITFGLFYLLMAVIAIMLLRTASASIIAKMAVMTLIVALACVTYKTLPDMFGYPVDTDFASLPQQVELIAFVPHDDEKKVDLWLKRDGAPQPRAYSVELTEGLKDTLHKAQQAQAAGSRVELAKLGKPGGKKKPSYGGPDGGDAPYVLLPNAFNLPAKDAP